MDTLLGYTLAALDDEICDDRGRAYYYMTCAIRVRKWAPIWKEAQDAVRDFLAKYPGTEAMIDNISAWWVRAKVKKQTVQLSEYLEEDPTLEELQSHAAICGVRIYVRNIEDKKIRAEVYIRPVVEEDPAAE